MAAMRRPLSGIRVVELAGLAPAPFCGMMLADFGAHVVRVDKVGDSSGTHFMGRHKRSISVDLKRPHGINIVKRLCKRSDVLIDPFRPGVMEKLGLGPTDTMKSNERLVYARLTGYGQTGKYSSLGGHDINYAAISDFTFQPDKNAEASQNIAGVLSMLGRAEDKPTPPINLLADFAGGGLLCAFGILAALFQREFSGLGQVVDMSMTEGAAYVSTFLFDTMCNSLLWPTGKRGANLLDSGFPIYDTYETADKKYMAVGALEPKFHMKLFEMLQMDAASALSDAVQNPTSLKRTLEKAFKTKTRDEWVKIFDGIDACVTPVLSMDEAGTDAHNTSRGAFQRVSDDSDVGRQSFMPQPAPRLSRTAARPVDSTHSVLLPGEHTREVLLELGYSHGSIDDLIADGTVEQRLRSKL